MALLITSIPAYADTRSQKVERARELHGTISHLRDKAEIAAENYNTAQDKHSRLVAQVRRDAAKIRAAKHRIGVLQTHLDTRASSMYRGGSVTFIDVLLGAKDFSDFASTWDLLRNLNQGDASNVASLKQAKAEYLAAKSDAMSRERDAARQLAIMKSNKAQADSSVAQAKSLLSGIQSQIAAIDAQAAAEAAARRNNSVSGWVSDHLGSRHYPHPTIPAHGDVVTYARSRLGCPYVWGAAGPNAFDCSGLAMWCYGKVGISLPHSSREQFNVGQHVSKSDLQPGDLVFFGSPIHHVGIYIGGGDMIEAPYSGASVRIASAFRGDYAGACRP